MRKPLVYVIVWLVATAAVGTVAWAAVRLAGEETQPRAVAPLSAVEVAALATSSVPGTATTVPVQDVATTTGPTATATSAATTTTTSATSTSAATATTVGPSTTVDDEEPVVVARVVEGGRVVVSLEEGRLSLVGATPTEGYTVDVKESGPDEVVVEFEGAEADFSVRAFVSAGEVVFEVTGDVDDSVDDSDDD